MGGRRRELVSESRTEASPPPGTLNQLGLQGNRIMIEADYRHGFQRCHDESHHKHMSTSAARSSLPLRGPTRAAAFPFPAAVIEAAQLASKYPLAVSWSIATQAQLAMLRFISGG